MNENLKQKLYYCVLGYLLSLINLCLMDTRFNIVGIGFGVLALFSFLKALSIKKDV